MTRILRGPWEEIKTHEPDFAGRRLQVIVENAVCTRPSVHGIASILTFNKSDFIQFPFISVVSPQEILEQTGV